MAEREKKGRRFSADEKLAIIEEARAPNTTVVEATKQRTGWNRAYIQRWLGVAKSRYHAWALRAKEHASGGIAATSRTGGGNQNDVGRPLAARMLE